MTSWQEILRTNFRSLPALCDFLELDLSQCETLKQIEHFPLNLPRRLAEKMEKGTIRDPLFLQFVSQKKELEREASFTKDPVEDEAFRKAPKLLVKYPGRALLVTTGVCAMHCRYCFRQHFAYEGHKGFEAELDYIRKDPSIREVILSGGDPLSLSNRILAELIGDIEGISHITRIRFHSRFLIGIPERVDEELLQILGRSSKQIYFVIHSNHPKELDGEVALACKRLRQLGVVLLNQSVLLAGVNDSVEVLEGLVERLLEMGVLPYYLHQLDRVEGAAHFEVERERGKRLVEELRKRTSGFGQFTYVEERPHEPSKTPLF